MQGPAASNPPIRDRLEARLEQLGHRIAHHPGRWILFCLVLAAGLGSQLSKLHFDLSDSGFLHKTDPIRVTQEIFERQFGRSGSVLIAVETENVWDLEFLNRLRALHLAIDAEIPQLEKVTSLINARNTYGRADELVVEDLMEDWPETAADVARLRKIFEANPLFANNLVSDDGELASIQVQLDRFSSLHEEDVDFSGFEEEGEVALALLTHEEGLAIGRLIVNLVEPYEVPGFKLHLTGGPIFDEYLLGQTQRDIVRSITGSSAVIALLLFLLFRRISGVVLPITVVALGLLSTMGCMAATGTPVTLPVQILPSFLLAVGVCGSVHLLVLFYRALDGGRSREDAVVSALGHAGLPIVMAGITTAGGLASFVSAELAPVMHFGFFGPLGCVFVMFFVLLLLPALLMVVPLRHKLHSNGIGEATIQRGLRGAAWIATRHPWAVVGVSGIVLLWSVFGIAQLKFSHYPLKWLPEGNSFRESTFLINHKLKGSDNLEILIETPGVENGLQDPSILARMDELRDWGLGNEIAGMQAANSFSVVDVLKETHQALNENRPEAYTVPQDPRLVAQELLLFENSGSEDLEDMVDSQFSMAAFTYRLPWRDAIETAPYMNAVEKKFNQVLGDDVKITLTGGMAVFDRTFVAVIYSMANSYALALLIVTPLMILLIGTVRGGLVSMAPNLLPILFTLGLMGWFGFDLDFSTMMIGAIALGVAVDDTIHFMHVFQRYCRALKDPVQAVYRTFETTGTAIVVTSIVLLSGFMVFSGAEMKNMTHLGLLTSTAIAAALLADLLIAPALMVLVSPKLIAGADLGIAQTAATSAQE